MDTTDKLSVVLCFKKKFFRSQAAADRYTKALHDKHGTDILRSYYCTTCMGFHLTKKPSWDIPLPPPPEPEPIEESDGWEITGWTGDPDLDLTGKVFLDHHEVTGYCGTPQKTGWICLCLVCGQPFKMEGKLLRKILRTNDKRMELLTDRFTCRHKGAWGCTA